MTLRAHHDFETRSALNLRVVGAHVYAKHPSTAVWCMAWRIGADPVQVWRPGAPDPVPLLNHVYQGGVMVAHNAMFEFCIWELNLRQRYCAHWPELRVEQQCCTLSRAAALGLPLGLDGLAKALHLDARKDEEGARLMMQMAKPRPVRVPRKAANA